MHRIAKLEARAAEADRLQAQHVEQIALLESNLKHMEASMKDIRQLLKSIIAAAAKKKR